MKISGFVAVLFLFGFCSCAPTTFNNCYKGKAYIGNSLNTMGADPSVIGSPAPWSCSWNESAIASTGAPRVWAGPNKALRWYIGEAINTTNPIVAYFSAGRMVWCRTDYETTADQSVGYGLLYNTPGSLYAVFSSRGQNVGSGTNDFRQFATTGFQPNYGWIYPGSRLFSEGASKVSVLAKLNPLTGDVLAATYLTSRFTFGATGGLTVVNLSQVPQSRNTDEAITVSAVTAATPLRADGTRMLCSGVGPYNYTIVLSANLDTVLQASSPTCA